MGYVRSVYTFRVVGASLEQRRVVRLVMSDLNTALGHAWFGLGRGHDLLTFSPSAFTKDPAEVLGWAEEDDRTAWTVALRPELHGRALYTVFCHELGHVLGLDHVRGSGSRGHVMRSCPGGVQNTAPNLSVIDLRLRRRFSAQIAALLALFRLNKLAS
jgi:hypothetical protein